MGDGDENNITEKRCSKCGCISWDSQTGLYLGNCSVDGLPHDANGGAV